MKAYYQATIGKFLADTADQILGVLTREHHHSLEEQQTAAWRRQISILKDALPLGPEGWIFFELFIPRMGKRADAILLAGNIVFVLEFKVGASEYAANAIDQVVDYALDLKNFHEGSHKAPIVPVLISTDADSSAISPLLFYSDLVAHPITVNAPRLGDAIQQIVSNGKFPVLDVQTWIAAGYRPTPTIIEAARVLYETHSVEDISRSGADAKNLSDTTDSVGQAIDFARQNRKRAICFVTGVPGSGKTLAGLNFATRRSDEHHDEHAVFLSGNGPLVDVLREALTRDKVKRERIVRKTAEREVRTFIQNVHHFRDEYLRNTDAPCEKVVVFDEAQRAWTREQTAKFMMRKRGLKQFDMSEPEFLLSVMNRSTDWCAVVCLVGGGQEINTGEAGISEWIDALEKRFPDWQIYASRQIYRPEYGTTVEVGEFLKSGRVIFEENLHLAVSLRSFRAETLSEFVGHVVDGNSVVARQSYEKIRADYPIVLTRDLRYAKEWLRKQARGTERIGLVACSDAQRLRAEGIHIKDQLEPAIWFLNDRNDVRSSFYLEQVASEFDIQGLELDWVGVCWDGGFFSDGMSWNYQLFKGTKWQAINSAPRRRYLKNAYRVLLTRGRQGMIIYVPKGDGSDPTRPAAFYDGTFEFLRQCGIPVINENDS